MPFNINTLKSNIENNGYLKNHSFEILLVPPPILRNRNLNILGSSSFIRSITNNLTFRIEQVRAPGVNIQVSDINRYGVGPTQKMPHNAQFQETTFSILVDGFGEIWQFWYNWTRSVFEFTGTEASRVGNASRFPGYVTNYKEDYSTTMQIVIYDMFGNAIQRINLYDAFPTTIRETQLSWNDNQNLMRLSVAISYKDYTIVGSSIEGNVVQPINSMFRAQLNRNIVIR
jgi:hypothetical protein